MTTGYFEGAIGQTDDTGEDVGFAWQATGYANGGAANRALSDGISRTKEWSSGLGCGDIIHAPCWIQSYYTVDGGFASYVSIQINACIGETKAWMSNADSYQNHSAAIAHTAAAIFVVGSHVLAANCPKAIASQSPVTVAPTGASRSNGPTMLYGPDCFGFRGALWGMNQRAADLQAQFWTMLESDYNNNYPPPSGGSVPGVTGDQFQAAQGDMTRLRQELDRGDSQLGLEWDIIRVEIKYHINPKFTSGPFNWAAQRVFNAAYGLDVATQEEWHETGSGLSDYQLAQQNLSNGWDALKQLPCH